MSDYQTDYQIVIHPDQLPDPFAGLATAFLPLCPHEDDVRDARRQTIRYAAMQQAGSPHADCFPRRYASLYRFHLCELNRLRQLRRAYNGGRDGQGI